MEIGIIGTGDFSRALAKRLIFSGFKVTCGSRNPGNKNLAQIDPVLRHVDVKNIQECISRSNVIFLAIPSEWHDTLRGFATGLEGKVLVDISNPTSEEDLERYGGSIAEKLASMFPQCKVVKAFNTLSAYGLEADENITTGNRDVFVASDDLPAKGQIIQLARDLGFTASDQGGLRMARGLERMPIMLFKSWGVATRISIFMLITWVALGYLRYYILKQPPFTLDHFPVNFLNKIMGCMAVTLLAFCFLPGCIAAFNQIINGTKYIRFSDWLDEWLKIRKQLGLYGLMFALIHIVMSLSILQPAYYNDFFEMTSVQVQPLEGSHSVTIPLSSKMNLKGECVVVFGLIALVLMCILGLTSVPAIGNLLNWREWVFVQSKLGTICLLLATVHVTIKGYSEWMTSANAFGVIQRLSFQSIVIPYFTLFLKLILIIPPISAHVWKIRRGWERGTPVNKKDD